MTETHEAPGLLIVPVERLRRSVRVQLPVSGEVQLDALAVSDSRVDDKGRVAVDLNVESVPGGVAVSGTAAAAWSGTCRRCLGPVGGKLSLKLEEVARHAPGDEDVYAIGEEALDLEPMVRDAVMLELPLAPLCEGECRGPAPDRYGVALPTDRTEKPQDPRWAVLDQLKLD